jgi:phosphatidylserine/phosphatidylglycerophosphate/cardiolipin synthase-like enzyme
MNSLLSSRLYDSETFYKAFEKDLTNAHQSVLIESPFITTKRMDHLLPIFRKLRQQGVRVVVNTRNPDEHDNDHATQSMTIIAIMQDIGVTVLYIVRHHRKLAIVDSEILWEGSLNILLQNDSCEIMRRTESKKLARQMMEFVDVSCFVH